MNLNYKINKHFRTVERTPLKAIVWEQLRCWRCLLIRFSQPRIYAIAKMGICRGAQPEKWSNGGKSAVAANGQW